MIAPAVSPSLPLDSHEGGDEATQHFAEPQPIEEEEEVDMRQAMLDEPIVGVEQVILDDKGPGAIQPRPLPSPKAMSPAQKAIHDLNHLPRDPGCPICASSAGLNTPHRESHEHLRVIPLLVADY